MMSNSPQGQLSDALRWALDAVHDPAMASADWLAMDIDPRQSSAVGLLTDPNVSLGTLRKAKDAYKTLRIVGETPADRRLGARLYLAAIAAAMVRSGRRITRQSDAALNRALRGLLDDEKMPRPLRDLAGSALCTVNSSNAADDAAAIPILDPPLEVEDGDED